MTQVGDPFGSRAVDTPTPQSHPPSLTWRPGPLAAARPAPQAYNTFAVLSPILAFVVPPAGIVFGHLALPQIRRTGELGRWAATCGLIVGYLLTVALIVTLTLWSTSTGSRSTGSPSGDGAYAAAPEATVPPPSVVTSMAPAPSTPRVKLDLSKVPVGTCAQIEKRDVGDDALDLFATPCEHRQGVYTVVAHVESGTDCRSTYVAEPPDHSFAVCLSEY